MLSHDELLELIQQGESDCVELTESISNLNKFREAICAFANDLPGHRRSGFLFIGIKDDYDCANSAIDDELLTTLGGLRSDGKIQPFPSMTVSSQTLNDCKVAVIKVEPSDNPPVRVDGRCWIRIGPRCGQATAEEERRLTEKRRWSNLPFDAQGVKNATVENDLDMLRFENEYLPHAVSLEALETNARSPEDQLKALRLTTQDGTPTATAILILGKEPNYWFPGSYIQFVRRDGNKATDEILDQQEIHGTLLDQLNELDKILKANIRNALDTSGETHTEKPDYPIEALRELSRNAVIHRIYESTHAPVRINWFTDNIEIINPGSVYGSVTKDTFGMPGITDYRNPTIAEAMKNLGFMQRFGMGIQIANESLKDNGNPELQLDPQDAFTVVTVNKRQ